MKFLLKPSLEHMALVKIGISLWNQNDVGTLISKLHFLDLHPGKKWKTIEEIVTKKVTHLSLPQLLKERVLGVIKPIGLELVVWRKCILMKCDDFCNENLPVDLCWTAQGTIDGRRTAELLVKNEHLDISARYKLACNYYLEEDIHKLWNSVPEYLKEYNWYFSPALNFWSDIIKKGERDRICYKSEFRSSAQYGYKFAAKYFFQKLTPRKREESLEDFPELYFEDNDEFSTVLCILLPEMEEEEQKKVFTNFPVDVLYYFLQWPLQSFFLGVANRMWDCLSKDSFEDILVGIAFKITDGYQDYDYRKLFREFWQKSPNALRDSVIAEIGDGLLVKDLCYVKDIEIIRLILKDATLVEKEKLIYSDEITKFLIDSIHGDEWDNVEFFIQECLSSTNERLKFKEEFEKNKEFEEWTREWSATEKQKWNQLFHFSDNSVCKYSKRSLEGGESSSSKRFQSLQ